jgi:hypothetical protein
MKITDAQALAACPAGQIFTRIGTLTDTGVYGVVRSPRGSMHGYQGAGY